MAQPDPLEFRVGLGQPVYFQVNYFSPLYIYFGLLTLYNYVGNLTTKKKKNLKLDLYLEKPRLKMKITCKVGCSILVER